MKDLLETISDATRDTRSDYHLTLGEFACMLGTTLAGGGGSKILRVCGAGMARESPKSLVSYRGYYVDLAMVVSDVPKSVAEFLPDATRAIDSSFEGYKGGSYVMDVRSPMWAVRDGSETGFALVEYRETPDEVLLVVRDFDR